MEAGRSGGLASANPHPRGTELAGHWADGWRDGDRQRREAHVAGLAPARVHEEPLWDEG